MRVVYGIVVSPQDDKYISVAEAALDGMARAANPGAFFVDFIPICECCYIPHITKLTIYSVKYLPYANQLWAAICAYILIYRTWMPGAGFKVKARYWRKAVMEMRDAPFKTVLEGIVGLSLLQYSIEAQSLILAESWNSEPQFRNKPCRRP